MKRCNQSRLTAQLRSEKWFNIGVNSAIRAPYTTTARINQEFKHQATNIYRLPQIQPCFVQIIVNSHEEMFTNSKSNQIFSCFMWIYILRLRCSPTMDFRSGIALKCIICNDLFNLIRVFCQFYMYTSFIINRNHSPLLPFGDTCSISG